MPKASRAERNQGLEGMEEKPGGSNVGGFVDDVARGIDRNRPTANHHPTVKPLALMRYLITLVTRPEHTVLDPFMGSGSTGRAAVELGRGFIGIEKERDAYEIATRRIADVQPQLSGMEA